MANSLITISMITNMAEEVLENNLGFTKHVKRSYDDQFAQSGAKIGDTLNIRLPVRYVATDGQGLQVQNSTESSVPLVLNKQYQQSMAFSTKDMTLSVDEFQDRFVKPAIASLANSIDNDGMAQYKNIYQAVGTPGTTPNSSLTYLQAGVKLDNSAAPVRDGLRAAVLNPIAQATLVNGNISLFNPARVISDQYMEGAMGSALGFKFEMDQNVKNHTFGTVTGSVTVATAPTTGATTIDLTGLTPSTDTIKQGDIFTIAGVYGVNPQSRESTGQLQQFVATSDVTADGSGNATVDISPAIVYAPGAQQDQTVDSLPAAGAAVTMFGSSGTVSPQNMVFHRDAFAFASADLILPGGVDMAARKRSSKLNVSIRLVRAYDINNDRLPARLDVIGGWATIRPQLACRVAG